MNLETRVKQLERQNRRFKQLGAVAIVLAGVAVAMGQEAPKKPKTIEAEKFVVVDGRGKHRATLGMEGGNPTLVLADLAGKPLMTFRTRNGKSAMYIFDANGTPRVELALAKRGPVLNFIGENSALRVSLAGAGPDSRLHLYQEDGGNIFKVTKEKLEFYDADGQTVVFSKP